MAILHSWCCWRSVRKGSFACGIYTAVYYTVTAAITSVNLHSDIGYLYSNETDANKQSTFLDHNTTSPVSIAFSFITFTVSTLGIMTSCLLLYGLYRESKILLLPWIINMVSFIWLDFIYVVYNFVVHALTVNPSVAILITIDLFLISLNMYALLCVISQYQELKAGRGRALDDQNNRVPNIHYSSQPTATSYLSTRKAVTYHETRPTPTQSPTGTGPHTFLGADEPSPHLFNKGPRKSVKFDHSSPAHNGSQLLVEPWTIDVKSPMLVPKGADTAPLISEPTPDTVLQSNL